MLRGENYYGCGLAVHFERESFAICAEDRSFSIQTRFSIYLDIRIFDASYRWKIFSSSSLIGEAYRAAVYFSHIPVHAYWLYINFFDIKKQYKNGLSR